MLVMQKVQQSLAFWLLMAIFLLAPFYFQLNIGGLGLDLPYNIAAWLLVLLFIGLVGWRLSNNKTLFYSRAFLLSLLFPVVIVFSGLNADVPQHIDWLFRQLYILGGFAFVFALFQLPLTVRQMECLLYCLVVAGFLQSFVAVSQIYDFPYIDNFIPYSVNQIPIGMFQQVNVLATYLATCLVIILYLISRPSFLTINNVIKTALVITFGLMIYVMVSTGSRIGILSFVLATALLLIGRWRQLKRHKALLLLLCVISWAAIFAAQSGFSRAVAKAEKMTEGEYSSVRKAMYATALDLIDEKPLSGYGIGSFQRVWVEQTAKFAAEHPQAEISQGTTSHPHNEILLWFIEGGLVAVFGLMVIFVAICQALYQCGFSRGMGYAALLLPITLHTQVELPFYISSVHWFVWLFLVFLVLRHQLKSIQVSISRAATIFIQTGAVFLVFLGGVFLLHANKAQFEISKYTQHKGGDLTVGLNDLYFHSFAEKLLMQTLLYSSIEQNNKTQIPLFVKWAEERIRYKPEKGMFIMLSDAYGFVGDSSNQCRIASQGLATYTKNERLQTAVDDSCL